MSTTQEPEPFEVVPIFPLPRKRCGCPRGYRQSAEHIKRRLAAIRATLARKHAAGPLGALRCSLGAHVAPRSAFKPRPEGLRGCRSACRSCEAKRRNARRRQRYRWDDAFAKAHRARQRSAWQRKRQPGATMVAA